MNTDTITSPAVDHGDYWTFESHPGLYCMRQLAGRAMTLEEYQQVLADTSPEFQGFKAKSGKTFSAKLRMNPELRRFEFEFPAERLALVCPKSGQPIEVREKLYVFPGFPGVAFWKEISRRKMTPQDYVSVVKAHPEPVQFHDFVSKVGKPFSAKLKIGEKAVEMVFDRKAEAAPAAETKPKARKAKAAAASEADNNPFGGF